MATLIPLDFAAFEPKLTPEAQEHFALWRAIYDDMAHHCRQAGDWSWAGELVYKVASVKRMCRKMPQPVSLKHMNTIIELVSEHHRLPVKRAPVVTVSA
jgi:hypothetical protein